MNKIPEIKFHCPRTPIVLVGNKTDLRDNQQIREKLKQWNQEPVKTLDAISLSKLIEAEAYLECSAKTNQGIKELFDTIARVSLKFNDHKSNDSKSRKCYFL